MAASSETKEAIVNEFYSIKDLITDNVTLTRERAPEGCVCLWRFDVKAPTHYLESASDKMPKATDSITFWIKVKEGFPREKPEVYYDVKKHLASVNAYRSGAQCIDDWIYDPNHAGNNSTLVKTVEKTIKDIIHDPSVSRFDSMANSDVMDWQKANIQNHSFPTVPLSHVFRLDNGRGRADEVPDLPKKSAVVSNTPPALPTR